MRRLAALLIVLLALSCRGTAPTVAPEQAGISSEGLVGVRKVLETLVAEKKVAGGVYLVARRGKTAALEAVGLQDVEAGTPMKPDTIFRICSMTKPMTSVAVMMLIDEGKLSLDDPLYKFVPEFKELRGPITIRQLLTHTSGLTYGFFNKEPVSKKYQELGVSDGLSEAEGTIGDHVKRLAKAPLLCDPGTRWEYGLSTDVLGRVVEVASGKTLDAFFRWRIFEPLGMKDTHFRLPEAKRARLATVYRPRDDKTVERQPDGPIPLGPSVYSSTYPTSGPGTLFSGGAGLVSTASDYARFLQMVLNGGELGGVRLLRRETVALMTSNQIGGLKIAFDAHGDQFGFGFGVVSEAAKDRGLGSPGTVSWGGFYHTYFFADAKRELVGVVMTQLYPWGHLSMWKEFREAVYKALKE